MDATQLERRIRSDPKLNERVWGVFARNELPSPLHPGGYVVNSQERGLPGLHWLAVYVTEDGSVEFMDSLGRTPSEYQLNLNCTYYSAPVQPVGSNACGLYVLYYLYWRTRGIPFHVIMSTLNRSNNDDTVRSHYALML
jgi:hypothetical protein